MDRDDRVVGCALRAFEDYTELPKRWTLKQNDPYPTGRQTPPEGITQQPEGTSDKVNGVGGTSGWFRDLQAEGYPRSTRSTTKYTRIRFAKVYLGKNKYTPWSTPEPSMLASKPQFKDEWSWEYRFGSNRCDEESGRSVRCWWGDPAISPPSEP